LFREFNYGQSSFRNGETEGIVFDLENRTVLVMLKEQGDMKEKRLTLEFVKAVQKHIQSSRLSENGCNYKYRMITEPGYNRLLHG
jgi:integrase/recombinase XerC